MNKEQLVRFLVACLLVLEMSQNDNTYSFSHTAILKRALLMILVFVMLYPEKKSVESASKNTSSLFFHKKDPPPDDDEWQNDKISLII